MKTRIIKSAIFINSISLLVGCTTADRILFVTKTNVGLDLDNKQPTAEITVSRKEVAIQPIYPINYCGSASTKQNQKVDCSQRPNESENKEEGKELGLPLIAAFGLQGNFLNPHITGHFAGGRSRTQFSSRKS